MNNAYFAKNRKINTASRSGMIRSYRTTRTVNEVLILILDRILGLLDHVLDVLVRPAVSRIIRGTVAIACVVAFLCLISAVEAQTVSILTAAFLSVVLVALEIVCLRRE